MTRVLVVASSASLALGMRPGEQDIIDLRPRQLEAWISANEIVDCAVLALPDATGTRAALDALRAGGAQLPAVVITGEEPDWAQRWPTATAVLSLPVSGVDVLHAVHELLTPVKTAEPPATAAAEPESPAVDRLAPDRPPPEPVRLAPASAAELVGELAARVGELKLLGGLADDLAVAAATAAHADAAAVLLPDASAWTVCGGCGLRPLEFRSVLAEDSWLVTTVGIGARGVLVEQTDIARQRLAGAPLANRPQLLGAPIPGCSGVLIAARQEMPFTSDELSVVADLGRRSASDLAEALQTRQLARLLQVHSGLDD